MKHITRDTLEFVALKAEEEGFDYCFRDYSSFSDVNDEEFHRLRRAYIDAAKELEKYIINNVSHETLKEYGLNLGDRI